MSVGYLIALIDLVVGVIVVYLGVVSARGLRGSTLFWSSVFYLATGAFFVIHAGVEVAGLGEELYAVTALVATIFLMSTMVIVDITIGLLGA